MKNCQLSNFKVYQKQPNNTNLIIKVDDIVKVNNRHYMIDSYNNNTFSGTDMYNNKLDFFKDDVQKIIYDSSTQTNILDYIQGNKLETLKNSLIEITTKIKNPITSLKHTKHLKNMKRKILEQINDLELENITDTQLEQTSTYKQTNLEIA